MNKEKNKAMGNPCALQRISALLIGISIGLSCLFASGIALAAQEDAPVLDEQEMLSRYETAMADGRDASALKYLLDYTERTKGENTPETVKLTYRYGHALYQDGRYREATEVLIKALERSTAVYGESGGEAFEINMNIGFAYGQWRSGMLPRMKYFDRALEILRERGEHESVTYVTTLINITVNLMSSTSLQGSYSSHLSDTMQSPEVNEYQFPIEQEYRNNFGKLEKYVKEAVEIAAKLETEDEYITSKVAILQAKFNVMETADLAVVPMGVGGYISRGTEREYYDEEQERLTFAIDQLSRDAMANQVYLEAANKILLEIAWLDKDKARMLSMCTDGTLNSAAEYSSDRLYEVMEGGMVLAPDLPMSVNKNLFSRRAKRSKVTKDEFGNPVKKPYFTPVCIDGRLMAVLKNVPVVTVEEM
jgi:tetratricopeptide (TPR) repeat protein